MHVMKYGILFVMEMGSLTDSVPEIGPVQKYNFHYLTSSVLTFPRSTE